MPTWHAATFKKYISVNQSYSCLYAVPNNVGMFQQKIQGEEGFLDYKSVLSGGEPCSCKQNHCTTIMKIGYCDLGSD